MKRSHAMYDALRRTLDIIVAAVALLLLSPVLLLLAVVVRATMGRPVLFAQARTGLHGRLFTLYKFRTMRDAPTEMGLDERQASDASRITAVGTFLRASSLDELPEFYNILRGDMSLIGPRPLLPEYLPLYSEEQMRRHDVRPGLTGWAQVNGRNAVSWPERFAMDVWYVDHRSPALDARILLRTVRAVLSRSGSAPDDAATMEPFVPEHDVARSEPRHDA